VDGGGFVCGVVLFCFALLYPGRSREVEAILWILDSHKISQAKRVRCRSFRCLSAFWRSGVLLDVSSFECSNVRMFECSNVRMFECSNVRMFESPCNEF